MAEVATACPFSLLSQPLQGPLKSKNTTGKITAQSNKKESEVFPISACVTMSYTMGDSWKWIKLWSYPSRWAHSCRRASLDTSCRQPQKSVRLLPSHSGFTGPPPQPAWAQHSPAESLGPSTHKTSHTHTTLDQPHTCSAWIRTRCLRNAEAGKALVTKAGKGKGTWGEVDPEAKGSCLG